MVVVDHIPIIDHQSFSTFGPNVDRATGEWLTFPGNQSFAVGAVSNAIVLPCKIVKTLAYEATVSTEVFFLVFTLRAGCYDESPGFVWCEVGLEDQQIGFVIIIVVGINSLAHNLFSGAVAHVQFHQILFAERC